MNVSVAEVVELIRKRSSGKSLEIDGDTVLADIGLSSLQIADVVFTVEDELGIEFDPTRAAGVTTVADLVALANTSSAAAT